MKNHDELVSSQLLHVVIPLVLILFSVVVSLYIDLSGLSKMLYFQRSGALLAGLSVYIAHHENRQRYHIKDGTLNIQTKIWYQWLALFLGVIGTLIWAYGDIPFS